MNTLFEPTDDAMKKADPNPMVRLLGIFEGQRCKNCIHFRIKRFSGKYFKCDLRPDTNGTATDIRANWNACKKFEFNLSTIPNISHG